MFSNDSDEMSMTTINIFEFAFVEKHLNLIEKKRSILTPENKSVLVKNPFSAQTLKIVTVSPHLFVVVVAGAVDDDDFFVFIIALC